LRLFAVEGARAERPFEDRLRALVERPRTREVALLPKHVREAVQGPCCIGMLGAERLLPDRQRAFAEWPRPRKVALLPNQTAKVVNARRGIGMLGAERLLPDRQRPTVEPPCLRIDGAAMKIHTGPVQKVSAFRVRSGVSHLRFAVQNEMRHELKKRHQASAAAHCATAGQSPARRSRLRFADNPRRAALWQ
jgi:hypothetical protein